jgi:regulatory protein
MPDNTNYKIALSKAMTLCSRSEYCSGDIRKKLQSWGVGCGDEELIIDALVKEKFLDDERYARAFVRDKFRHNKWGRIKISAHLKAKGITGDNIGEALREIDNEEYISLISNLILAQRKKTKAKNQFDLKGKLFRYGLSKGFENSILYDILNDTE